MFKMKNSVEILDRQSQLYTRCHEIVDNCKKEIREMTEDEAKEFSACKEEIAALKEEMKALQEKLRAYDEDLPKEEEDPTNEDTPTEGDPESEGDNSDNSDNSQEDNSDKKEQKSMEKVKFNLLKELRGALQTGKKINLSEVRSYSVNAEGEDVVATDLFDIWEPLRAKNVLVDAGAQYISGIKNNVQIPLMGAVSVNWAGELAEAADGSGSFTKKTLAPKRITAKYPISLELLAQDSIGVEAAIRADIIKAVNSKLEETLLGAEAGSATKPAGLFNGNTPTYVSDFKSVAALEANVENANVTGECKYIVSPKAKADLRGMIKGTNGTGMVFENGAVDGTPALATSNVAAGNFVYGDFSNLVIATWDNVSLDVVRDVASLSNGVVTIVINAYVDAALVREQALVFGTTVKA